MFLVAKQGQEQISKTTYKHFSRSLYNPRNTQYHQQVLDLKMSLKNERVKSVEQTESALREQGESFRAERQALEAEVARCRNEVQKLQVGSR